MAPETHTRYRVQRLIRLGEWLERNQDALVLAYEVINEAHDTLVDPPEDMPNEDIVEQVGFQQLHAVTTLRKLVQDLRFDVPTRNVKRGEDVTLHHPLAWGDKQYEVVIKAPKPQGIPTKEEFDKVRSEIDGIY